jgi:KRAB domain-containing zinc finger protein
MLRFKCSICGRECPSKHKLKRHLSTHSEARPFPCKLCGRSFKWTEYLQKHMRQQHPSGKAGMHMLGCAGYRLGLGTEHAR